MGGGIVKDPRSLKNCSSAQRGLHISQPGCQEAQVIACLKREQDYEYYLILSGALKLKYKYGKVLIFAWSRFLSFLLWSDQGSYNTIKECIFSLHLNQKAAPLIWVKIVSLPLPLFSHHSQKYCFFLSLAESMPVCLRWIKSGVKK